MCLSVCARVPAYVCVLSAQAKEAGLSDGTGRSLCGPLRAFAAPGGALRAMRAVPARECVFFMSARARRRGGVATAAAVTPVGRLLTSRTGRAAPNNNSQSPVPFSPHAALRPNPRCRQRRARRRRAHHLPGEAPAQTRRLMRARARVGVAKVPLNFLQRDDCCFNTGFSRPGLVFCRDVMICALYLQC